MSKSIININYSNFITFLCREHAYNKFEMNFIKCSNDSIKNYCSYVLPRSYVSSAFSWFLTPKEEGINFWREISINWNRTMTLF
jgi:hypothetical protein